MGANWRRCLLRRCRAQKLCEKGKGARRGGQFTSGSLPNGTDKGGGIHCMHRGPSRIQIRPNMLNHGRRQGGAFAGRPPERVTVPPTFHPLPSLLNMIDFESESETDKTAHIRKPLHTLGSISNCTRSQITLAGCGSVLNVTVYVLYIIKK